MLHRLAFLVMVGTAAIGCYNPSFKEGIACGADGACPPGLTCDLDSRCRRPGTIDAPPTGSVPDAALPDAMPSDAPPDAAPVECQSNDDCQQPPDMCSLPGTCNLASNTCTFVARDCSSLDDACNRGLCHPQVGCVRQAIPDGMDCGAGTTCTEFGLCDYSDVCDSNATQSRTCTDNKCQSGTCTRSDRPDTRACTRGTNGTLCDQRFTNCTACSGSSENGCAFDGNQTCTCTDFVCQSDTCQPASTTTCNHSCAELVEGALCAIDPDSCGNGDLRLCCNGGSCGRPCGCIER
jgi:hypothetical protein